MVIQNHALPDSDQNSNSCYRSLIHRYFIGSQNAVFSILCSYFFKYLVVIVIAAGERGGHHQKVILSSKLKNHAPVFLLFSVIFSFFPPIFSGEKILFSYFSDQPMCWAPCYSDIIMSMIVSQISGIPIVCSIVCSGAAQWKPQRSTSLAFVRGIHRWPVDSPHKRPVMLKMFPFDDFIVHNFHQCKLPMVWLLMWGIVYIGSSGVTVSRRHIHKSSPQFFICCFALGGFITMWFEVRYL